MNNKQTLDVKVYIKFTSHNTVSIVVLLITVKTSLFI